MRNFTSCFSFSSWIPVAAFRAKNKTFNFEMKFKIRNEVTLGEYKVKNITIIRNVLEITKKVAVTRSSVQ